MPSSPLQVEVETGTRARGRQADCSRGRPTHCPGRPAGPGQSPTCAGGRGQTGGPACPGCRRKGGNFSGAAAIAGACREVGGQQQASQDRCRSSMHGGSNKANVYSPAGIAHPPAAAAAAPGGGAGAGAPRGPAFAARVAARGAAVAAAGACRVARGGGDGRGGWAGRQW